jgi:hypothetical protein
LRVRVNGNDTDVVVPTQIEHNKADQGEQRDNFIDYHFELDGVYSLARAYLDDLRVANVGGPFERRGSVRRVDATKAKGAVLAHLRRRFRTVRQFQAT